MTTYRNDLLFVSKSLPVAWYRYGVGLTDAGGGLCSAWADQSGNGNNLVQGTGGNQPAIQADNSILFDGADNFMAAAFTLNQPTTAYLLYKGITWTSNDAVIDGSSGRMAFLQTGISPNVRLFSGSAGPQDNSVSLGAYAAYGCVFNGASSVLQVNNTSTAASDVGAENGGGVCVGSGQGGAFGWSNIQVKEVIVFASAHDADTRARVIRYLAAVGGLAI